LNITHENRFAMQAGISTTVLFGEAGVCTKWYPLSVLALLDGWGGRSRILVFWRSSWV